MPHPPLTPDSGKPETRSPFRPSELQEIGSQGRHSGRKFALLMVVTLVLAIVAGIAVSLAIDPESPEEYRQRIQNACAHHDGVAQVEGSMVICRDGTVTGV